MRNNFILGGALIAAVAAVGASAPAHAELKTSFKAAPEFSDGDFKFKIRGRVMMDVASYDYQFDDAGSATDRSGTQTNLRRARLGVEGQYAKQWKYKAEVSFLPGNTTEWESLFLEYVGKNYSILIGNHKETSPLEEATSSRYITFMERSAITNATDYGYKAGIALITGGPNWFFGATVQGDSINNTEATNAAQNSDQVSFQARGSWAPIMNLSPDGASILHLGASIRHRENGGETLAVARARPAGMGFGDRFISQAANRSDVTYGLEGLWIQGPFSVQGEYLMIDGKAAAAGAAATEASGFYFDGIWNFTGESRTYKGSTGLLNRPVPRNPVSMGGAGLWQVGGRIEQFKVEDAVANGASRGDQEAYTLGLHWFPEAYIGFKLNYAHTEWDRTVGTANDGQADVISVRTQFDW